MFVERSARAPKRSKIRKLFALATLVVAVPAFSYWKFHLKQPTPWDSERTPSEVSLSIGSETSRPMFTKAGEAENTGVADARPVFPYSVIPGGARNSQELQNAVARDSVVARHYAGFVIGSARTIRLSEQRTAYVSYRMGNQIFWTRRKVTLRAGETLLTDGQNLIRGRCGNRVSTTPKNPTSPNEPPENVMSKPEFSTDPGPIGVPSWAYPPVTFSLSASGTPLPPGGAIPPGYIGLIPAGSSGGRKSPDTPPPPPVSPVATPEPGSGMLIVSGLFLLLCLGARKVI